MAQAQIAQTYLLDVEMSYADLCRKLLDEEHSVEWCRQVGLLREEMDCPGCEGMVHLLDKLNLENSIIPGM